MFGIHTHHDDTTLAARRRYAHSIEGAIHDARSPQPPWALYRWQIFRPRVMQAAAPALLKIAELLRDPAREVSAASMARLHWLLTEGAVSPLHGVDPSDAAAATSDLLAQMRAESETTARHPVAA